jgi:YesN/AraC family two-component response regulator
MTVLIVDDEATVREGLKAIIDWQACGFDICEEGADGGEGLSKMLSLRPELTLLDIKMPKLHGLEAAERARAAGYTGKIVILSGYSDFKYAQSAIRHGVDAYLLKPIEEDELIAVVAKAHEEIVQALKEAEMARYGRELARNDLLCGLLLGRPCGEQELEAHGIGLNGGPFRVVLVDFGPSGCPGGVDWITFMRRYLRDALMGCAVVEGKLGLLLRGKDVPTLLPQAVEEAGRSTGFEAVASIGKPITDFRDIPLSYKDALGALAKSAERAAGQEVMPKLIAYVNKNYDQDLSLESLAERFGYNSAYLGKLFKRKTGDSFIHYVDKLRIERAELLLREGWPKIYDVCRMSGYSSLDCFYKKFRKHTGMRPSEYRKRVEDEMKNGAHDRSDAAPKHLT